MRIQIIQAKLKDKPIIRNLMELYQYDFSEIENNDVNNRGLFGYKYLDHYWTEATRKAFLIKITGKIAGFVLINKHSYVSNDKNTNVIAEFFIMRKYRKKEIGTRVAMKIFDVFPGKWEVLQTSKNKIGQLFWRKVIKKYTKGNYREVYLNNKFWKGPVQLFSTKKKN